jgi:hypothetical protein
MAEFMSYEQTLNEWQRAEQDRLARLSPAERAALPTPEEERLLEEQQARYEEALAAYYKARSGRTRRIGFNAVILPPEDWDLQRLRMAADHALVALNARRAKIAAAGAARRAKVEAKAR